MRADEEEDTTAESMALPPRTAKGEEEVCSRLSTEGASRRKIAAAGVACVVEDEVDVELQEAAGDEYITTARINRSINQSIAAREA